MQCFSMGCRWYYRRCRCRLMTDSYKFWEIMAARGITQDIFEQNAMGEDEKHQLKTWIQGLADHRGRTLYKAEIKMNKAGRRTSAEICTRCNCHTIGGLRWFYSQCSGRIAADSLCFWKAVPRQSFLGQSLCRKGWLNSKRGLLQGCPLSPLLAAVVMQAWRHYTCRHRVEASV